MTDEMGICSLFKFVLLSAGQQQEEAAPAAPPPPEPRSLLDEIGGVARAAFGQYAATNRRKEAEKAAAAAAAAAGVRVVHESQGGALQREFTELLKEVRFPSRHVLTLLESFFQAASGKPPCQVPPACLAAGLAASKCINSSMLSARRPTTLPLGSLPPLPAANFACCYLRAESHMRADRHCALPGAGGDGVAALLAHVRLVARRARNPRRRRKDGEDAAVQRRPRCGPASGLGRCQRPRRRQRAAAGAAAGAAAHS